MVFAIIQIYSDDAGNPMAYTYDLGTVDSAHEHDGFGFGLPLSLSCVKSKHTYVVSRIVQVDMCGSS